MPVKAIIFDMDGVLLDSMSYHVKAWRRAFRPLGVDIPEDEVYAREGEDWRKSTKDFLRMGGYRPTALLINNIFKKRNRIFRQIFKTKIFPGAAPLLKALKKKGFSLALVTATPRDDVKRMLPPSMAEFFDAVVCGGDTKKGKPHPLPYIRALDRLRLGPKEAVAIENSPYGIRSSVSAGINCIAVTTSLPAGYLKEAHVIVDSLEDVKHYCLGLAADF